MLLVGSTLHRIDRCGANQKQEAFMKIAFTLNGIEHTFESAKLPEASIAYGLTRGLREFVRDSYADETEKAHGTEAKAKAARIAQAAIMVERIAMGAMPTPGEARGPRDAEAAAWRAVLVRVAPKAKTPYIGTDVPKAALGVAAMRAFTATHFGPNKVEVAAKKVAAMLDDTI
jgi:hypothetical protein